MKRKEFVITERQLTIIRENAKKYGISQNESLRRLIDSALDTKGVKEYE